MFGVLLSEIKADKYMCSSTCVLTSFSSQNNLFWKSNVYKKSLKIPNWQSKAVNWRRTENTTAKKGQKKKQLKIKDC